MNLPEIKKQLDKLQQYYEFLAASSDVTSHIDRDTFLMQLRELYDLILSSETAPKESLRKVEPTPAKEEPIRETAPKEEPIKEPEPPKKTTKLVFNQPETIVKEERIKEDSQPIEEPKKTVEEEKIKQEEKVKIELPVQEEPKVEEKKPEPTVPVQEEPKVDEVKVVESPRVDAGSFNEDFEELFVFKQATDLAAKLSQSPIANLSVALSLNDKHFYTNELFGGDAVRFTQAVDFLNSAGNFDRARVYIEEQLILQLDWLKKEKKESAKNFIKLVRRRYF